MGQEQRVGVGQYIEGHRGLGRKGGMQLFTLIRGGCISFSLSLIVFKISACAMLAQNKNLSVLDYLRN